MTKIKAITEVCEQKTRKDKYRVTNWKEYNASLKRRGSLEIWIEQDVINN